MANGFIDKARITVRAGNGGNGAVAFHREKYIAAGGPDGGDGGSGGSIILKVDDNMSTLMDFRYKRKYVAGNGVDGQGGRKTGKDGESLTIKVPRGTLVRDAESGEIIKDMSDDKPYVLCRGGRGGWGNQHFATPTRQVPRFAKAGLPGESHDVVLELKLLADVGLVGFPNVGKSTLLSVVSKAHPKIANYHFTTLYPNLGVVYVDEGVSFVMADIPGIIEGASEGAGLGHDFLRHIDRCRLLVHVVDVSGSEGRDPVDDFNAICDELANYSVDLSNRPMIVAANKIDLLPPEKLLGLIASFADLGYDAIIPISAKTGDGLDDLTKQLATHLPEGPKYFPDDMMTDQPERLICAELIREKALQHLRDEVPHGIGVEMMGMEKMNDNFMEINATIYCERDAHKGIIIGKHGAMLQTIGSEAREDIEKLLGLHVNLKLWVKVRPDWRNRASDLRTLGYDAK